MPKSRVCCKHGTPKWEYTLRIKVRFRDNPVVSLANVRQRQLVSALDMLCKGWAANTEGIHLGDMHRPSVAEIELWADYEGHSYTVPDKETAPRKGDPDATKD